MIDPQAPIRFLTTDRDRRERMNAAASESPAVAPIHQPEPVDVPLSLQVADGLSDRVVSSGSWFDRHRRASGRAF